MSRQKTRGEGNAQAKLNETNIKAIRRAYDSGAYTMRDLAKHYDISSTQTHRIIHQENWRHVPKSHESNETVIRKLDEKN